MIKRRDPDWNEVQRVIDNAIREDIGEGDVTTLALFDRNSRSRAAFVAKEDGVLAGIPFARAVFDRIGDTMDLDQRLNDGERIRKGDIIAELSGRSRDILSGERLALNILQRLCGIATITSRYVEEVSDLNVRIVDTRKTTPGLRVLEKYAVTVGGGFNHRMGLYDAVMIKDNHIKAAGGIRQAVSGIRSKYGGQFQIEVETQSADQVGEALKSGCDIIMLDNMALDDMRKSVRLVNGRVLLEASGGITLETVRSVAETGVDMISVGAITHSVKSIDISLDILSV